MKVCRARACAVYRETPGAISSARTRFSSSANSSTQILTKRSRRPAARYARVAFFLNSGASVACSERARLAWNSSRAPSCSASPPNSSARANVHRTTKISCQSCRSAFCTMSARSFVTTDWKSRRYGSATVRFSKYAFCARPSNSGPPFTARRIASAKRSTDKHRDTALSKSPTTRALVTRRSVSLSSAG